LTRLTGQVKLRQIRVAPTIFANTDRANPC
jgi:hypothetical protein